MEWFQGHVPTTLQHVERALELVAGRADSATKARVMANVSRYRMLAGRDQEAIAPAREALAMAESLGLDELRAHALNNIGTSRASLGDPDGLRDLERSIEIAEAAGSVEAIRGYINLASITGILGDLRRGNELHRRGLEVARQFGNARNADFLRAELIIDGYFLGDWDDALRDADAYLAAIEAGSPFYMEAGARLMRGAMRLGRGDLAGAVADTMRSVEQSREIGEPQAVVPAVEFCAFLELEAGNLASAARLVDELVAEAEAPYRYWFPAVFAYEALGRLSELQDAAERHAARSRWAEAARLYVTGRQVEAADVLAEIGSLVDEAHVRLRGAEALAAAGRRDEADAQLEPALAFYRRVGAARFTQRAERLLPASA